MEQSKGFLRDLAKEVYELAHSPAQQCLLKRFKKINALIPSRPPVELFPPPEACAQLFPEDTPDLGDPLLTGLARQLQAQLLRARVLPSDAPVTDILHTGLFSSVTDWMEGYKTVRMKEDYTSSAFEPCILSYDDLKKLRMPQLTVDWKRTDEQYERISELLGDILDVRRGQPFTMTCGWGESMIDQLAEMRGLEQLYFDMLDAPEFIHEAMELMTQGKTALLEQYRAQGALFANSADLIGSCSYSFNDALAYRGESGRPIGTADLWGFAQAQEFAGVSTDMLEEFVLPYQARVVNQFGLVSYGCCEPIDHKIDAITRHIKNLRILSVSPYSDLAVAAQKCRGRFVMACKMHPALTSSFQEDALRNSLRTLLEATQGCCLTINFAEIIDYGGDPSVFLRIGEIAEEMVDEYYEPA